MTRAPVRPSQTELHARLDQRVQELIALNFDPRHGAPFWLRRQQRLGLDARHCVRGIRDLPLLGNLDPSELAACPLTELTPGALLHARPDWVVAQTGGTTGKPAWTAYSTTEFHEAFVAPFAAAARHVGFPRGGAWLYAGPSGPHIIGRAAVELARVSGSPAPFMVDFDPRWARKLPEASFARERYLAHVVEQALNVLETQSIEILFSTPPILAELARRLAPTRRSEIRGVHYGGMRVSAHRLAELRQAFPAAVHLSGYGNTLFGCCLELSDEPGRVPEYFPFGERLLFHRPAPGRDAEPRHGPPHVRFTRLDSTMLLVNVVERDVAELTDPPAGSPTGFVLPGVRDPRPACTSRPIAGGLY